jgi:hypothetical protein
MKVNTKRLMGIFIVSIMVLSVFGIVISYQSNTSNQQEYNGIAFRITDQGWLAEIDGQDRVFQTHPSELQGIAVTPEAISVLQDAPSIILTYNDTSEPELLAQLQFYLEEGLRGTVVTTRGTTTGSGTLPQVTCEQATPVTPVIVLTTNVTGISYDNGCVTTGGLVPFEMVQHADRLQYIIMGIMNE